MSNDRVLVIIPNKPDYTSTIRLISSSIGNKIGYNIDEIEDLKVAMGEACILAYGKSSDDSITVEYLIYQEKLQVTISWKTTIKKDESKECTFLDACFCCDVFWNCIF